LEATTLSVGKTCYSTNCRVQRYLVVSNAYTFRNKKLQQKVAVEVKRGEHHLKKSRTSSTAKLQTEENLIRQETSSIREKDQCSVTVKLTCQVLGPNPTVALERKTPVETAEEAPTRDNGWREAILVLGAIEEQLWQMTYGIYELMEENHWKNHEQLGRTRAWIEGVRNTVTPLVIHNRRKF